MACDSITCAYMLILQQYANGFHHRQRDPLLLQIAYQFLTIKASVSIF